MKVIRILSFLTLHFLILFLTSCAEESFKKYQKLSDTRVLAIKADTPEISSSQNVNITLLISDVQASGRTLTIRYQTCSDPGINFGKDPSCEGIALTSSQTTVDTNTLGANFTGETSPITINVPASAFAVLSTIGSAQAQNGINFLITFDIQDATQKSLVKSFKRIKLSTKTTLNTNPSLSSPIQLSGSNLTTFPSTISQFSLTGLSAPESYEFVSSTQTFNLTEELSASYFTSAGEFKVSQVKASESVEFDPQGNSSGVIVVVIRDGRGGVDYRIHDL